MSGEILRFILLGVLACLLVAAAITDLRARIISNRLNLAIALLAPIYWWACGLPAWPDAAIQTGISLFIFILFAGFFAMGWMGGGDVKLLGALALWFPWQALLTMLFIMAVLGGIVTTITVIHHKMTKRLGAPEVPYGVAISLAALWLVAERYLNQFA